MLLDVVRLLRGLEALGERDGGGLFSQAFEKADDVKVRLLVRFGMGFGGGIYGPCGGWGEFDGEDLDAGVGGG